MCELSLDSDSEGNGGDEVDDEGIDPEVLMIMCIKNPNASPDCLPRPKPANCDYSGPTTIGSNPPAGCYLVGYETYHDIHKIDWWNVGINGFGIIGDGALFLGLVGVIPGYWGYTISEVGEGVGFFYSVSTMDAGNLTLDVLGKVAEDTRIVGKLFPFWGATVNYAEIYIEWKESESQRSVYAPNIPDIPYIITP